MEITPCTSDEDYEHWRRVRIAVIPYERTQSVAELRAGDTPERLRHHPHRHPARPSAAPGLTGVPNAHLGG